MGVGLLELRRVISWVVEVDVIEIGSLAGS